MNFKTKLLLIAILPLVAVSAVMWGVISYQTQRLSENQVKAVERQLLAAKKAEIQNYIKLALTAVQRVYRTDSFGLEKAQNRAKLILRDMTFGKDGYFFVYDDKGVNLMHPRQPELEGRNLWSLKDPTGNLVIQDLIAAAKRGGDFHRYIWNKPSDGKLAAKLGYAVYLDKWNWMIGTGLYIDDIDEEVAQIRAEITNRTDQTASVLFLLTLTAVGAISILMLGVKFSEQKFADTRLKELTKRIVNVQEDERKRVSHDLHDGINQLLVSVRYSLDLAETKTGNNPEARNAISKAMGILDSTVDEVRRISRELRPSILDDIGLNAAVKSLARDFEERTGIAVQVTTPDTMPPLNTDAKTSLYRITQEALTNVAKHADAQSVHLSFERSNDGRHLILLIEDDGIGFDPTALNGSNPTETGLGLRNMRERIEMHGGTLAFNRGRTGSRAQMSGVLSPRQHGTSITISIPIDDHFTRPQPMLEAAE